MFAEGWVEGTSLRTGEALVLIVGGAHRGEGFGEEDEGAMRLLHLYRYPVK